MIMFQIMNLIGLLVALTRLLIENSELIIDGITGVKEIQKLYKKLEKSFNLT